MLFLKKMKPISLLNVAYKITSAVVENIINSTLPSFLILDLIHVNKKKSDPRES